jgi:iron complex outermembrane receptor protein
MKYLRTLIILAIGAFIAASPATTAIAQDGSEDSSRALEEIIVTAQKREQNLQELGISVTALSAEAIARAGITDVSRLELVTPGMTYGFIGTDAKVAVRGANSNNTFKDNASVAGAFIDGVYVPRAAQQRLGYFDVQRIEVLKGPQGTLYGRNTFAGAINIYTNGASTDSVDAGIDLTTASFNKQRIEGFYNAPVSDQFALRFAGAIEKSDGWVKNIGAGRDAGIHDSTAFRLSALWDVSDTLTITARFTTLDEGGTSLGVWSAEDFCYPNNETYDMSDPFGTGIVCESPSRGGLGLDQSVNQTPWTINSNTYTDRNVASDSATVQMEWDLDSMVLKSITSYTAFESLYTGLGQGGSYYWTEDNDSISQELALMSTGGGPLQWTVGAYVSQDELWMGYSQFTTGSTEPYTLTRTDAVGNVITVPHNTARIDLFGGASFSDYNAFDQIDTDVFGLFSQVEWSMTDNIRLIAGVRANDEKKNIDVISGTSGLSGADAPFDYNPTFAPSRITFPDPPYISEKESFDKTTWRVGFEWGVNDDSMFYANSSNGFLSGGMNSNGSSYEQQESLAYEFGYKSRWLGDRLQFNAAWYRNEYTELTAQKLIDIDGDGILDETITENGGDMTAQGLEFELTWLATDNLEVTFNGSFMDNEYGEFGVSNPFLLNNGVQASDVNNGFIDLSGTVPGWSPDMTLGATAAYTIDLGSKGRLTPYLQMYYSDGYNTDDVSIYITQWQDSYTKTDFRLIWNAPGDQWTITAFVENIEDEAVLARTNTGGAMVVQGSYIYPRNYGLKASFRY